jgi:predicted amidohydrolase
LETPLARLLDILAVQAAPHPIGTPFSTFAAEARTAVAAHSGLDLLVFPELHLFHAPYAAQAEASLALRAAAQPLPGAIDSAFSALAAELGVTLIPGTFCEAGPNGELFNTARVYGADGKVLASYRKVFPWRPREPYDPGQDWVTFDLPGKGRIGLTICYDAWFPEATRQVAWLGAELVVNLVKTTTPDRAQELILARAAAISNQIALLSVNCAGPVGKGDSLLAGPEGEILAQCAGAQPGTIRATVDFDRIADVRHHGTCGENRVWAQFRPGDACIPLPAYNGHIDPATWDHAIRHESREPDA